MEKFLESLVKKAGFYLLDNFKKDKSLLSSRATSKEIVTKYDRVADELIRREIEKKYPEHSILGEESGFRKKSDEWLWIVDSLDGTGNFANFNPLFCVCAALMKQDQLQLGAVFAPAIDEFYFAKRGGGAYFNGKRIKVSGVSKLSQSYAFYCEGREKSRRRIARVLQKLHPKVKDIRKIGCAGLETSWVASGRGEIYWTPKLDPWDLAPGVLLVQEAGGKVTDLRERPWHLGLDDFLFTNGKLHKTSLRVILSS
ncbi:MAG: myo-inositol-1(or 4)-monophosphatase [Parcubacteria group bacterium Gr01-1014_30]|nr:MAG: myo-inositol-1(or 4)-monophosphatase [Parcubacteria group bacterium Gr01-1014_30]